MRGRRGTFGTFVGVRGTLATHLGLIGRRGFPRDRRGTFGYAGPICVAGVVLSGPLQVSAEPWRRIRSDWAPRLSAAAFRVTGVVLSATLARFSVAGVVFSGPL